MGRTETEWVTPMQFPPYPGLSIRGDCLEPPSMTIIESPCKFGASRKQLSDVVNLRLSISPDRAIRFGKVFGGGGNSGADCKRTKTW